MNSDIFEYKKNDGDKNELGFDDTLEFEDVELDLGASEDSLSCDEDELLLDGDFLSDSSDVDHHMLIRDLDKHGISFWREANSDKMLKVFVYYDDGSVVVREIKIDGQPQRGTMVAANRPYSASVMKHLEVFNSAALEIHDDALSIADAGAIFESIHWTFRCPDQPFFRYDHDIEAFIIKIE
jgi:hypothetical protein